MSFFIEKEAQVQSKLKSNKADLLCSVKDFVFPLISRSLLSVSQSIENSNNGVDDSFTRNLTSSLEKLYGRLCTESAEFMANASLQVTAHPNRA